MKTWSISSSVMTSGGQKAIASPNGRAMTPCASRLAQKRRCQPSDRRAWRSLHPLGSSADEADAARLPDERMIEALTQTLLHVLADLGGVGGGTLRVDIEHLGSHCGSG